MFNDIKNCFYWRLVLIFKLKLISAKKYETPLLISFLH